jgi:hypothetical protein
VGPVLDPSGYRPRNARPALNRGSEFRLHPRAMLTNGVTRDVREEIRVECDSVRNYGRNTLPRRPSLGYVHWHNTTNPQPPRFLRPLFTPGVRGPRLSRFPVDWYRFRAIRDSDIVVSKRQFCPDILNFYRSTPNSGANKTEADPDPPNLNDAELDRQLLEFVRRIGLTA